MFYFISDTHFGHSNIIKYQNRPFSSVEHMNESVIYNYNKVVTDYDTVIFVGDVFFLPFDKAKVIMDKLKGKKILVRGNHDFEPNTMLKLGFDFVCDSMVMKIGKTRVNINHYPYRKKAWNHYIRLLYDKKYRFKSKAFKKLEDNGEWLIHGHTHSDIQIQGKQINMSVEAWKYTPVPITKVSELIDRSNNGRI